MIDTETTIRDLETIGAWHTHHYTPFHYECAETIHNALELLKEQEPVSLICDKGLCVCGNCGNWVYKSERFCSKCGRAVKWDD